MRFRLLKTNKQLNCKSWNKKFLRDKFHMNSLSLLLIKISGR